MNIFMHNSRCGQSGRYRRGQNITEYLILVTGVLVVVILATSKGGFFTKGVEKSINMMFDSVEDMATEECLGTLNDADNGRWNAWSEWKDCTWISPEVGCLEYSTHTCNNPPPGKCGGLECKLELTEGYTTRLNPVESKSQPCHMGSWTPGTCPADPSFCTGACGSTVGTCTTSEPDCDTGCCDPAGKPPTTIACAKKAYPDKWPDPPPPFGACNKTCGDGIASRSFLCSGTCCDAALKPPTRRACAVGCCEEELYIGRDIENNVDFKAAFGPAKNGEPDSAVCPPGYAGTPTYTCAATASTGAGCAGGDSFAPPEGCYTIRWDGLSGECKPADCKAINPDGTPNPDATQDAGYGLTATFPDTLHGEWGTINCADPQYKQADGVTGYTGTAEMQCWLGKWMASTLVPGCVPNCPAETVDIGAGVSYPFPETPGIDENGIGVTVSYTCETSDKTGPQPCAGDEKYEGEVSRTCNAGTWSAVSGACSYKSCPAGMMVPDDNGVNVEFPKSDHGVPQTVACPQDQGYTGSLDATCEYGTWCGRTGNCVTATVLCPAVTFDGSKGVTGELLESPVGTELPLTLTCGAKIFGATATINVRCMEDGTWKKKSGGCDCEEWEGADIGNGMTGYFHPGVHGERVCASSNRNQSFKVRGIWTCNNPCGGYGYGGAPYRTCRAGVFSDPVSDPCFTCPLCPPTTRDILEGDETQMATLNATECKRYSNHVCPANYIPPGQEGDSAQFYCNTDGTWSDSYLCKKQTPACTEPECGPDECGITKTKCDGTPLTCRACVCTDIPSNASQCWGDNPPSTATADISATLVDSTTSGAVTTMDCTTTTQCEYYCNDGYVKSADGTKCETPCACSPTTPSYTDATVGSTGTNTALGPNECGQTRTVSCNEGYTGASTVIKCEDVKGTKTWTGDGPACTANCGNKVCDSGECLTCPDDCTKVTDCCGDKVCSSNEHYGNCPDDCPLVEGNLKHCDLGGGWGWRHADTPCPAGYMTIFYNCPPGTKAHGQGCYYESGSVCGADSADECCFFMCQKARLLIRGNNAGPGACYNGGAFCSEPSPRCPGGYNWVIDNCPPGFPPATFSGSYEKQGCYNPNECTPYCLTSNDRETVCGYCSYDWFYMCYQREFGELAW